MSLSSVHCRRLFISTPLHRLLCLVVLLSRNGTFSKEISRHQRSYNLFPKERHATFFICLVPTRNRWLVHKLFEKQSSCCFNVGPCQHPRRFTSRLRLKASHWPITRDNCSSVNIIRPTLSPTLASTQMITVGAFKWPTLRFRLATSTSSPLLLRKRPLRPTMFVTSSVSLNWDNRHQQFVHLPKKSCLLKHRVIKTPPHKSNQLLYPVSSMCSPSRWYYWILTNYNKIELTLFLEDSI